MRMGCDDEPGDKVSVAGRSRSVTLNPAAHRIIWGALKHTQNKQN